jgi:hypothetical protein
MGKLLAGAAKVNVTPPIGTPLSGYSARTSWFNRGAGDIIEQKAREVVTELMV